MRKKAATQPGEAAQLGGQQERKRRKKASAAPAEQLATNCDQPKGSIRNQTRGPAASAPVLGDLCTSEH